MTTSLNRGDWWNYQRVSRRRQLLRLVLPTLEHSLQAIAIWVKYICSVIPGVVIQPSLRFAIVYGTGSHCGFVKGIYFIIVFCDKADMCRTALYNSFTEPEKNTAVTAETF